MSAVDEIWANLGKTIPFLNTSKAGIIRRIAEVVGTIIDIVRLEILRTEQTITEATRIARITTEQFYLDKVYAYQEGDNLVVINNATQELGYATIDPSKQIIKQASMGSDSNGSFFVNVATANSQKNLVQLSASQLVDFKAYFDNFIAFGAQSDIASNPPAIFNAANLYIRYNKTYALTAIRQSVYDALHDLQIKPRNSVTLYINEIETYLTNIEGIDDAYFSGMTLTDGDNTIEPVDGTVLMKSGYFNFNPNLYDWNQNITIFEAV